MKKPWWNKKYGKESICVISYSRIRAGKDKNGLEYSTVLPCGHIFYTKALYEWIKKSDITRCPMCRQVF